MRTKLVDCGDGITFTISSLSLKNVEKYITNEDGKPAQGKLIRDQVLEIICLSLNAVREGKVEWTVNRAREEMDLPTVTKLQTEILELSGLAVKTPGEDLAAPKL